MAAKKLRVVALISGRGSNLQALIDGAANGELDAEIVAVISNRPDAGGLARAAEAGIATASIDHKAFDSREAFDAALAAEIDRHQPELVVLAGFMRILTGDFIRHYEGRLLNIHPSLLPKYQGLHTHQRAIDAGDSEAGCSVHFATEELDGGPVILQAAVPIEAGDDADALAARVLTREHLAYPAVVQWFAEGRLRMHGQSVILDGQTLSVPASLLSDNRVKIPDRA
jgi:phosphoribosylglycinamide formyltransferase-1